MKFFSVPPCFRVSPVRQRMRTASATTYEPPDQRTHTEAQRRIHLCASVSLCEKTPFTSPPITLFTFTALLRFCV